MQATLALLLLPFLPLGAGWLAVAVPDPGGWSWRHMSPSTCCWPW